ncbi:MAG: adenylate kinase [Ruminococcus sp.]|nr:adenylate kinase [Ruminococcus sp.]
MNLILLGAPGAGKGTQAAVISERLNIPQISTGNIIREALRSGTEMGLKAKSFMDAGKLVPDEVVIGIIKDRLQADDCKEGFILDGFPRTIPQAEALDEMGVVINKVIDIEVPDEVIINRLSGRRVCEKCGRPYHTESLKPKVDGICDDCTGALIQRKDDQIDTIKNRLEIYHSETEPLKGYYEAQGKLAVIDGQGSVDETIDLTMAALEA